jgi:hypothetical protein
MDLDQQMGQELPMDPVFSLEEGEQLQLMMMRMKL